MTSAHFWRTTNSGLGRRFLLPLLAATLAVSACAGAEDDPVSKAQQGATTELPAKPASGTPVKIGFLSPEGGPLGQLPDARAAAEAATKYVNENLGGIAGRPIDLVVCKEKEDPASARDCANQLVAAGVVAVVAPATGQGDAVVPVIAGAGIPYVTTVGPSGAEMTTPNSFVLSGGVPAAFAGAAKYSAAQGYKRVAIVANDAGSVVASIKMLADPSFQGAGVAVDTIGVPVGTPDMTPQVSAALAQKPDAVFLVGESGLCTAVLRSLDTLGSKVDKLAVSTCLGQDVVEAAGTAAVEGAHVISSAEVVSDDPDTVLFRTVMAKYTPDTDLYGFAFSGYQPLLGLVRAVQNVQGEFTPAAVIEALRAARQVPVPLGSGLTFTCDGQQVFVLTSVCGRGAIVTTVRDGKPADPQVIQ
ncbi:ABC transporter substrate-binding protein [Nocardia takedensis]